MRIGPGTANFRIKRHRFGVGSLIFLCLFGAVFTSVGLFAVNVNKADPGWARIYGKVTDSSTRIGDGSTTYSPVVEYEVEGQSYSVTGSIGTSSYPQIGSKREVAYNPAQPAQAKVVETAKTAWFLYLFPIIGIGCLVIAPVAFIRSLKRSGAIQRLMQSGQKLQGVIVDLQSSGDNRDSRYQIVVAAADPMGIVQHYTSDPVTGIGSLAMADFHNNPIPVDVYVDPTNPDNYYVDIADIPNLTPERITELIKTATSRRKQ